jgi:hypothetical protein
MDVRSARGGSAKEPPQTNGKVVLRGTVRSIDSHAEKLVVQTRQGPIELPLSRELSDSNLKTGDHVQLRKEPGSQWSLHPSEQPTPQASAGSRISQLGELMQNLGVQFKQTRAALPPELQGKITFMLQNAAGLVRSQSLPTLLQEALPLLPPQAATLQKTMESLLSHLARLSNDPAFQTPEPSQQLASLERRLTTALAANQFKEATSLLTQMQSLLAPQANPAKPSELATQTQANPPITQQASQLPATQVGQLSAGTYGLLEETRLFAHPQIPSTLVGSILQTQGPPHSVSLPASSASLNQGAQFPPGRYLMGWNQPHDPRLVNAQGVLMPALPNSVKEQIPNMFVPAILSEVTPTPNAQSAQTLRWYPESGDFPPELRQILLQNPEVPVHWRTQEFWGQLQQWEQQLGLPPQRWQGVLQSLYAAESLLAGGEALLSEQRDLILRFAAATGELPLSASTLSTLLKTATGEWPDLQNLTAKVPHLEPILQEAMGAKGFLTGKELLQVLEQVRYEQLQKEGSGGAPAGESIDKAIDMLRAQQWDRATHPEGGRASDFYWMQEGELKRGRLQVRDERESKKDGAGQDRSGGIRFTLFTQGRNWGALEVGVRLQPEKIHVSLLDQQGKYSQLVESEKEELARELNQIGLVLESFFYGAHKQRRELVVPTNDPIEGGRLDIRI